jgi:molybdate transport system substrate-binding protein
LYLPDTERSTAGMHCVQVLRALGIHDDVIARVRAFPNGAIAMRELAQSRAPGGIGCTQITEIRYTPGVALVGPLPPEFELATVYSAAVTSAAQAQSAALEFVQMLTAPESRELRRGGGFEA